MHNIKSAKKRVIVAETRRARNMAAKAAMKTQLKKFAAAVEDGDKSAAERELLASKMPPQDGNPIFIGIIIICNLLTPLFSAAYFS